MARSEGPWSPQSVSLTLNSTTTIITIVSATPTAKGKQRRKGLPRLGQASDQGCVGWERGEPVLLTSEEQERQGPVDPEEVRSSSAHACSRGSDLVRSTWSYCSELTAAGEGGAGRAGGGCL